VRIVAYLRVSTNGQVERFGLDAQRAAIMTWAKEHGHHIVETYADEGVSGLLRDRAGLADALAQLHSHEAEGIVVMRLDRLARDSMVQESIMRDVWSVGAEVLSTADTETNLRDDPEDPSRRFIRQILAAAAQFERELLTLRMMQGRREKKRQGGKGEGRYPFGWGKNGPVEREQGVLAHVRVLRARGTSWQLVADDLNKRPHFGPRTAERWSGALTAHLGRKAGIS
jgi:DNA invertase Pin-like site-specific DNA recombinase